MRRDRLGRRVGRNWWREWNVQILRDHNDAVDHHREDNHQMEAGEYSEANPLITFKELLIRNAGTHRWDVA